MKKMTRIEETIYEAGLLGNLAIYAIERGDSATAAHYARNAAQYYFEACGNRKVAA